MDERPRGLRERKKERTRDHIAESALTLFCERGFDRVTVADVARSADVAEQTVFNYFPAKDDLVYWRLAHFEEALLGAIGQRPAEEPVLAAFRRFVLDQRGLLGDDAKAASERLAAVNRVIAESPALLARERHIFDHAAEALAALLAEERGRPPDDIEAWTVANSLVGVHRALVAFVRTKVLAGAGGPELRAEAHARAHLAFSRLERGLGDYGVR
ncbi:MAG: TetR family transcriptional regulator [Dehalococcoidia bacterium]|nr:TetR family transcriptional regulator [Dehalococcoidia bacterium]